MLGIGGGSTLELSSADIGATSGVDIGIGSGSGRTILC